MQGYEPVNDEDTMEHRHYVHRSVVGNEIDYLYSHMESLLHNDGILTAEVVTVI